MSACASLPGLGSTVRWHEEVVLHNGKTLIVERTQTVDKRGLREIGQGPPLSEEVLVFTMPNGDAIRWRSDFGRGYQDNLSPLVLDIVDGTPYLVTYPTRCHAYNKWGRPNPPYVYFRYGGRRWRRIALNAVLPIRREANLLIGGYRSWKPQLTAAQRNARYLSAEEIRKLNRQMSPDTLYLRRIARKPIKGGPTSCEELVFYKGAWISPGDSVGKRLLDRMSRQRDSADTRKDNSEQGD